MLNDASAKFVHRLLKSNTQDYEDLTSVMARIRKDLETSSAESVKLELDKATQALAKLKALQPEIQEAMQKDLQEQIEALRQEVRKPELPEAPDLAPGTPVWLIAVREAALERGSEAFDVVVKQEPTYWNQWQERAVQEENTFGDAIAAASQAYVTELKLAAEKAQAESDAKSFKIEAIGNASDIYKLDASASGSVDLGDGKDAVELTGNRSDYRFSKVDSVWHVSSKAEGRSVDLQLVDVEYVKFNDGIVILDATEENVKALQFVRAMGGSDADLSTILYAAEKLDFYKPEALIKHLLPRLQLDDSDLVPYRSEDYVKQSYRQIFGREVDEGGLKHWTVESQMMDEAKFLYTLCRFEEAENYMKKAVAVDETAHVGDVFA
ncbi:hypothetical protein [Chelatococcus sp. YT9]|nr:hypothetical protein [Chelatococcus sp. YT9]MBS7697116.1 hypothetical protein [Chelatococcus sp. YT9]MBX3559601.1 hypothetical protein [Chelatococcus sp.]